MKYNFTVTLPRDACNFRCSEYICLVVVCFRVRRHWTWSKLEPANENVSHNLPIRASVLLPDPGGGGRGRGGSGRGGGGSIMSIMTQG